jgi:regulator of sigma E protease
LENVTWLLNILKVVFGLGFVIFLHELGHFLLAKWNGVKVEKFSIGFGRTLIGFKKGETEYVVAAIPLGGFVKMLGEGPEDQENKSTDPRAYPNKSVGARMAIISAGVIMNLLLGLACFVYAYGTGMEETPAKVGIVKAGTPAYEAGLRPGDEIIGIDDRGDVNFDHLMLKVRLSGAGQKVHFDVKRPGRKDLLTLAIEPRREATADMPSIGITPDSSLTLGPLPYETPAGTVPAPKGVADLLKPGDTLVALGPEGTTPVPVDNAEDYHRMLAKWADKPLTYVFERSGDKATAKGSSQAGRFQVTLPPNHFVDFGLRLTMEPISSIQNDSIADRAGFRKGDKIVKVNDRDDFDPMRLPTIVFENAGKPMTFEVERPEPGETQPKTVTLTVTPDDTPAWTEPVLPNEPVEVPGLGLAYPVVAHVDSVVPGSPADKAGLKKGDTINAMTFLPPADEKVKGKKGGKGTSKPEQYDFKEDSNDWPSAYSVLQILPPQAVELTVNHSNKPISITPAPDLTWHHPLRGLRFRPLVRHIPPQPASVALKRGFEDTIDNILGIYAMFRSLAQQRVSPKVLGGPPAIAQMAYASAASSWTDLIHFLGILSINLAVLNFLPIPPLDGGQMAFLIAEKVRGRPLPDSAVIVGSWMGLLLVLSLMAFVIFQDVARMLTG